MTRGRQGAAWYGADGRIDVQAADADVADTIGAGDTFGAAILDALWDLNALGGRLTGLGADEIGFIL